jgi:cystathionine gamma-synthase
MGAAETSPHDGTLHDATLAVTSGRPTGSGEPLSVPIVPASTYRAHGAWVYGRDGNAGWSAFEDALGDLEGGRAVAFSSGVAAVAAVLSTVPRGGVVVAPAAQYHGVAKQLKRLVETEQIQLRTVDFTDQAAAAEAIRGASFVWVESPTNPLLDVIDVQWVVDSAHDTGASVGVDSTLATPLLQRPLQLGADVVVHSATKAIGGHSDTLLGVAVTRQDSHLDALTEFRHDQGSVPGALEVFLALRGLRTLSVRMERAQATAAILSERLREHPAVQHVRYPGLAEHPQHDLARRQMAGFGSMISFETVGDTLVAERVVESLQLLVHGTSLGGVETMIERRARYEGDRAQGVPDTLLRMSVGLEHHDDLWKDLKRALDGIDT